MPSLYAQYAKERLGQETVESEKGFATYEINGDECYIVDIYVVPSERRSGEASRLADRITEIALAKGCKVLTGTVYTRARGATASIKTLLAYGFEFASSTDDALIFLKELKHGSS